jgi:hypothetical protein
MLKGILLTDKKEKESQTQVQERKNFMRGIVK